MDGNVKDSYASKLFVSGVKIRPLMDGNKITALEQNVSANTLKSDH